MRIVAYVGAGLASLGALALSAWLWSVAWWVPTTLWLAVLVMWLTAWSAASPTRRGQHGRKGPRARQNGRSGPNDWPPSRYLRQ